MTNGTKFSIGRTTRILVVDDHPLVRAGLAARIADQRDLEISGEAASADEALAQLKATSADLPLLILRNPGSVIQIVECLTAGLGTGTLPLGAQV
ncbi:MAG: hypothetical protein WD049_07085 [Candidatus Paceibacterota bacterium]